MNSFKEMFETVVRSPYYDEMVRFCQPLRDHFGINHFWHYTITNQGEYGFIGTHTKWSEYCFTENLLSSFPILRHPDLVESGITFMKLSHEQDFQQTLTTAWDKFKINFNINIVKKLGTEIEAFGFASAYQDLHADERLINRLPLLEHFVKAFKEKNHKLLKLLENSRINIAHYMGERFFERPKKTELPSNQHAFLRKIGYGWVLCLTPREQDILALLPTCQTSQNIARILKLSYRTVENYQATIKSKLFCYTKAELAQKALEFIEIQKTLKCNTYN